MALGTLVAISFLGLVVGSFLNVCIHRLPREISIVFPGSRCTSCSTPLQVLDNVPLFSFIRLRGRCRYCGESISWRYPLVEVLNSIFYMFAVLRFGVEYITVVYAILFSALIVITFIDLEHQIIPNEITLPGILVGFIAAITVLPITWWNSMLGLLIGGGVLFCVVWISPYVFGREGMGMGDAKMLGMLGAFLGWKATLLTLLLASFFGAFIGIALIAKDFIKRHQPMPFGPFLALGAVLTIFFGEEFIEWYSTLFYLADPRFK